MIKALLREKYKQCCTRNDFFNMRQELKNFNLDVFEKEMDMLKLKSNPLAKIVLGRSMEKSVDFGKLILTVDRYDKNHYLLIPKDLSYFNVLTMKKEDVQLLQDMKAIVKKHVGEDYVLFFHCYPYNSLHTLHLHVIQKAHYVFRNNDLDIEDVIFVLENEENFIDLEKK